MPIIFHEKDKEFHLTNGKISYIFNVLKNGQLGQLYFGKAIKDRQSFKHLLELRACVLAPCSYKGNLDFSMETIKQEYPTYGTGDYRDPAYALRLENGSRITNFEFVDYKIYNGKKS